MTTISVPFKKSFVGTSLNGQLFHWLKCTYGETVDEAIDSAVRLIYSPSSLAASSTSWGEVKEEVAYCRDAFQEMMSLVGRAPAAELPIPGRITVEFGASIELVSNLDKTYQWLIMTYGSKAIETIIHAVHLVYLPAVLAASPDSGRDPSLQVERSRIVFEQQIRKAIWESSPNDKELITSRLEQVFRASPSEGVLDAAPPLLLNRPSEEAVADFDDGLVPVEPDEDF